MTLEQRDTGEGGIVRTVLAALLIESLLRDEALGKTFEAHSNPGEDTTEWTALLGHPRRDAVGPPDAIDDVASMPLEDGPAAVRSDLDKLRAP